MSADINNIHARTEAVVGPVEWDAGGARGLCACPGAALHTSPTKRTDCTVFIEGAPSVFCFHTTCAHAVAELNKRLRRTLGGNAPWEIILPDGSLLRSGEVRILPGSIAPLLPKTKPTTSEGAALDEEKRILRDIKMQMECLRGGILEAFAWGPAEMFESSPRCLKGDPADDWHHWLRLWEPNDIIWCGNTFDSGKPHHAANFRPAKEWRTIRPSGQFTCGSAFAQNSFSRSNENARRKFLVVESDTLTKEQMGAVILYLTNRLFYTLHAVVDTGGKSLHGWLGLPNNAKEEERLKVALIALGCDAALFKPSQPVRVPGATRDNGNNQHLLWCRA